MSVSYMQVLFIALFVGGVVLLLVTLFSMISFTRTSRIAVALERIRRSGSSNSDDNSGLPRQRLLSFKERVFRERAKLAGLSSVWSLYNFNLVRYGFAFVVAVMILLVYVPPILANKYSSLFDLVLLLIIVVAASTVCFWIPMWMIIATAASNRSKYLVEIALFSERLALCVTDKAEIREVILRASRPLKLLKGPIQRMAEKWQVNQKEAIWGFKEEVAISEVFSLVNALDNISRASAKDIVTVLRDQTDSIEATLESEVNRSIENAPISISFLIMIPFFIGLLLFLYPWVSQVQLLMDTNF